jgi:uncharacterized protein YvpB
MPTLKQKPRWLTILLWILCIGIAGNIAAFFMFSKAHGFSSFVSSANPTSTIAQFGRSTNPTQSATPFQPLPTNTSTATPTPLPTSTPQPTSTPLPPPTSVPYPTQPPVSGLPPSATVSGIVGHAQSHTLSCESRSAVDWAAFYGVTIGENTFQGGLPLSDNPDKGFVGDVNGAPGQIPPDSYGVHAEPVAALLREYGVSATAARSVTFTELKQQIASGNPVIVWVIGNVWGGTPIFYTASDGSVTTVANFEHTAILIGYDEYGVTVVDGNFTYWRAAAEFTNSFSVLGNMAVYRP